MGNIKAEVWDTHLNKFSNEEAYLAPFRTGFDINWGRRRKAYNTELSVYFLGPEPYMVDTFGFDHEIMLVVSLYDTIEARSMQAIEAFFGDEPAKGRIDQSVYFLITPAANGREWVTTYTARNPQSRIPVVFQANDLLATKGNDWLIRSIISDQLFARDLFDYQLPLDNDLFFFGRDQVIADNLDAIRRSQNRGLFGLRKTGKTSVLYKLKRMVEREGYGKVIYYDCKLPSVRALSWQEMLTRIIDDVSSAHGISVNKPRTKSRIPDAFVKLLEKTPEASVTALIFDEIEYISPLSLLDDHWKADFIPFWQTLWSTQSTVRRLSNIIAGVNPTIAEVDTWGGVQNPMFGIVQPRFLRGLELSELRSMVRFFGKRMGVKFSEDAFEYLYKRYGGHPLLTRLACSQLHKDLLIAKAPRPVNVYAESLSKGEENRDNELIFYCRHVVSELKQFYPDEYDMLEYLATGQVVDFMDLQIEPQFTRHLLDYGLIEVNDVQRPRFAIPVIGRYIGAEMARQEGRRLRRHVVAAQERESWVKKRTETITRECRALEGLLERTGGLTLFGTSSFPESERFSSLEMCAKETEFVDFINICNRCFVESVERAGRMLGKADYFWNDVRNRLPELWEALHRIKVYRHKHLHLELNPRIEEAFEKYLLSDLEGKRISQVEDVWFVLQESVLDSLLIGIQCEMNRLS